MSAEAPAPQGDDVPMSIPQAEPQLEHEAQPEPTAESTDAPEEPKAEEAEPPAQATSAELQTAASAEPASTSSSSQVPQPSQDTPSAAAAAAAAAAAVPSSNVPEPEPAPTTPAPVPSASHAPLQQQQPAAGSSRTDQIKHHLKNVPEDVQAWTDLVVEFERKGDLDRTREVYEDFLNVFPDAGKIWVAYADLELRNGLFPRVESIFARCLRNSTSVDLWAFYITYIRRMNKIEGVDVDKAKTSRIVISKSYEFCLLHVGQDRFSGSLWSEYIAFLKSSDSSGTWEAQQNMDNVRKAYQRAVGVPLNNVEQIWSEYNHWEQQLNKVTAKRFIGERGAAYMTARGVLREMNSLTSGILTGELPQRPDWKNPNDRAALDTWQRYLKWEESNPLQLDDLNTLQGRVLFAYRKAFAEARFLPPIWFLGASYAKQISKSDDAFKFFEAGAAANPLSLLLNFSFAEIQEGKRNFAGCYKIYENLIDRYLGALATEEMTRDGRIEAAVRQAKAAVAGANGSDRRDGDDEGQSEKTLAEEIVQIKDAITQEAQGAIDEMQGALASMWIGQMRFARRSEGIKQARTIFSKARRAPHLAWQVIEANAMMEYHWNKEPKVATNVFELGLKTFSENVDYVLRYLEFLINTNDDTNARAVFERTVSKVSPEAAKPLWERWFRYESQFSDLAAIHKLDERIGETYPTNDALSRFVERHSSTGLHTMLREDLGMVSAEANAAYTIPLAAAQAPSRSSSSPGPHEASGAHRGERRPRSPSPAVYERRPAVENSNNSNKRARHQSPSPPRRAPSGPAAMVQQQQQQQQQQRFSPAPQAPPEAPKATYNPPARRGGGPQQAAAVPPMTSGPIPDGVLYFLSQLPSSHSFNGPILPGPVLTDLMGQVQLPTGRPPMMMGGGGPVPPRGPAAYDRRSSLSPRPHGHYYRQ